MTPLRYLDQTSAGFVLRTQTIATPEQIAAAMADAFESTIGGEIPPGTILLCTGQWCVEVGNGLHMWNWNGGNMRGTFQGKWTSFRAGEIINGKEVFLDPGPANKFRSYGVVADGLEGLRRGVEDYLSYLQRRQPKALARAAINDVVGFVRELHAGGYFTAHEATYLDACQRVDRVLERLPIIAAHLHAPIHEMVAARPPVPPGRPPANDSAVSVRVAA